MEKIYQDLNEIHLCVCVLIIFLQIALYFSFRGQLRKMKTKKTALQVKDSLQLDSTTKIHCSDGKIKQRFESGYPVTYLRIIWIRQQGTN